MIWYDAPARFAPALFFSVLLLTALLTVITLESGELLRDKKALFYFRSLYGLLALTSALLSYEGITAIASIEGGIYLPLPVLPRYTAILPALLCIFTPKRHFHIPARLQPTAITFFIPLLFLPPVCRLSAPLPVFLTFFAVFWLLTDSARLLYCFVSYSRKQITRDAMARIIRGIDLGLCLANRLGWIIETNPAFTGLCLKLGIPKAERVDEFDAALKTRGETGLLKISYADYGTSIQTKDSEYFLHRSTFTAGRKTYTQIALSDVTTVTRAATELERNNEILAQNNRRLEEFISDIEREETFLERERLCRTAHDLWSQRLAVAGLTIDMLLGTGTRNSDPDALEEITYALDESAMAEPARPRDLPETLSQLTGMYLRLGVQIRVSGQASFTARECAALSAVFHEAFANAVRHAYSRSIEVIFREDGDTAGVVITNDCLDDYPFIAEGRGLHDVRSGVDQAGGTVRVTKSGAFELEISFPVARREGEVLPI